MIPVPFAIVLQSNPSTQEDIMHKRMHPSRAFVPRRMTRPKCRVHVLTFKRCSNTCVNTTFISLFKRFNTSPGVLFKQC